MYGREASTRYTFYKVSDSQRNLNETNAEPGTAKVNGDKIIPENTYTTDE